MLYMVIERFRNGDPLPVYRRFRERGRLMPDGLKYVSSWITNDLSMCWQVMECGERELLERWMAEWNDLMDFEVHAVMTSPEAAATVASRL